MMHIYQLISITFSLKKLKFYENTDYYEEFVVLWVFFLLISILITDIQTRKKHYFNEKLQ